jgi:hypothetical protein
MEKFHESSKFFGRSEQRADAIIVSVGSLINENDSAAELRILKP